MSSSNETLKKALAKAAEDRAAKGPPETVRCPSCNGTADVFRAPGERTHYRCRNCGWDTRPG